MTSPTPIQTAPKPSQTMSFYGVGPLYYGISAFGAVLCAWAAFHFPIFVLRALPQWLSIAIGSALILGGVTLYLAGLCSSRIAKAVRDGHLVTDGIYAYTRNPLYCGGLLGMTGILLILQTWLALPFLLLSYLFLRRLVRREEAMLARKYGREYLLYRQRTNAVFPGPKRA